jgi:hypothetical protein
MSQTETPPTIPDLDNLTDTICEILEFMNLDEMVQLKNSNKLKFEEEIDTRFSDFSLKYPSLLTLLIENKEENLHKLTYMIGMLQKIQDRNITMDSAVDTLRESLASEYVYPQFGGKENFENSVKNN